MGDVKVGKNNPGSVQAQDEPGPFSVKPFSGVCALIKPIYLLPTALRMAFHLLCLLP